MTHSQPSGSMPGGVLFSIYPESPDTQEEPSPNTSTSQDQPSLTVSANVLDAALPADDGPLDDPAGASPSPDAPSDLLTRVHTMLRDDDLGPSEKIQRLLELGTQRLGMEGGALNLIDPTEETHRTIEVAGSHPADALSSRDLSVTYCRRLVTEKSALAVKHAEEQGWLNDPAYETFGFSTYLGARVHSNGEVSATVCFASSQPREAPFDDEEATFLAVLTQAIGQLLEQKSRSESS